MHHKGTYRFVLVGILLAISGTSFGQLTVSGTKTPTELVEDVLLGAGVTASNITYTGDILARGEFNSVNSNIGFDSGVLLTTGSIANAVGPNNVGNRSRNNGEPGDADINAIISPVTSRDAAVLEFDFKPISDTIMFNYIFASEEYPEYAPPNSSSFNDAFAFLLTGPNPAGGTYNNVNIALIPGTSTPVSINNVNAITNTAYYQSNGNLSSGAQSSPFSPANINNVQFDAFTTPLTAIANVVPCATYHIKLVVADAFDFVWDSGVFLEANSFGSTVTNPTIDFVSTTPACDGDTVSFLNTGSTGPGILYSWDFGPGATPATSTLENPPSVVYSNPGLKLVQFSMNINCGDTTMFLNKGITIDETPVPSFTSNAPQCEGESVDFIYTGSNGANWTFQWDFGNGAVPSISTAQNPSGILYSTPGVKTVTLTVRNGNCLETITQNITINARPTASFSSTGPVGIGYGVDFTNSGSTGATYSWNFGSGASPATSASENPTGITYSSDGTKTVTLVTSASGCSDTAIGYVNVLTTPNPSFASDAPQPVGFPVNFTYTGNSGSNFTYTWDFGAGAMPSSSNSATPPSVYYTTPGVKTITLTVTNGSITIVYTQTIVIDNPPVSNFTSSAPQCEGVAVDFQNSGPGSGTYSWDFGSGAIPATSSAQNPTGIVYSSPGFKTVQLISTLNGNVDTSEQVIYIIRQPQVSYSSNAPVCRGDAVNFNYTGSTGKGWTYTWDFGSGANRGISSSNSPQGVLYNTSGSKDVMLTVTNGVCTDSSVQSIVVEPSPTAGFASTAPACTGDTVNFTNSGSQNLTYSWDFGNGSSPSTSSDENPQNISYSSPGIKSIRQVIVQGNCADTALVSLNIIETPDPSFTNIDTICQGSQVSFTYTGNSNQSWQYQWDFGGSSFPHVSSALTPPDVHYSNAGIKTISLTVTNQTCAQTVTGSVVVDTTPVAAIVTSSPVCTGDSLQIGVNGINNSSPLYSYDWLFTGNPGFDSTNLKAVFASAGIEQVQLVLGIGKCRDTASASVVIHENPQAAFTSSAPVCQGESVDFLNVGSSGKRWQYNWDFGTTAFPNVSSAENPSNVKFNSFGQQKVLLQVSDVHCSNNDSMLIEVRELPVAHAGTDTILCADDCIGLGQPAVNGMTYQWFPSLGLDDANAADPVACPSAEFTQYVLTVTNDTSLCVARDTVLLTMLTSAMANAGPDVELCVGDSIQIGAASIEGQTYQWTPTTFLSDPQASSPQFSSLENGRYAYSVAVSYKDCEAIQDEVIVVVRKATALAGEDVTIAKGEQIELNASGGVQYTWTPARDLSNSRIPNPIADPEENTTYVVEVVDAFNCTDSDSILVRVVNPDIFIPTAFTPNGSGANDVFRVRGNALSGFVLTVFNRNGEVIYYSEDFYSGWDGTDQRDGSPVQQGAYVYRLRGFDENGEEVLESGIVNLIR